MFVFVFRRLSVSSVGRSVGWLDFFLVDLIHEIGRKVVKKVDGGGESKSKAERGRVCSL